MSGLCIYSLNGSPTYAKFVVDSVNDATRRSTSARVGDPNCGYRSLVPDSIPNVLMHDLRLVRERLDDLREAMRRRGALDALGPQLDRAARARRGSAAC